MSGCDVISELRAALRASTEPDAAAVGRALAEDIAEEHLRPALAQALARLATGLDSRDRAATFTKVGVPGSAKWANAARFHQERVLSQRVPLGGATKLLRDCARDDLLTAAARRRDHVEATLAQAQMYEKLAALLDETGAATVGDLDDEILGGVL